MKRFFSFFLALLMVFSLSACSPESQHYEPETSFTNPTSLPDLDLFSSKPESSSSNLESISSNTEVPSEPELQSGPEPEQEAEPEPNPTPQPNPEPEANPEPQYEPISTTVYITKTGEKYHRSGCQYLRKSCIAISLESAKNQGYGPCSKCKPPQ